MAKIMVLWENAEMAGLYKTVLQPLGYELRFTSDKKECQKAIQKEEFDLLLICLETPNIEDIMWMEKIRALKSQIGIFVFSGFVHWELIYLARIEEIADRLIEKPFQPNELTKAVEGFLKSRQ